MVRGFSLLRCAPCRRRSSHNTVPTVSPPPPPTPQNFVEKFTGGFIFYFLCTLFNTSSSANPSDFTVSEDAGMEPRTGATSAVAVRRSNHSARSHST
jgi:hypothetical protein